MQDGAVQESIQEAVNGTTSRRFIFSDEFYDNIEDQNKDYVEPVETTPSMEIPTPVPTANPTPVIPPVDNTNTIINDIPKVNDTEDINKFFTNQVVETTTVYDSVGNTISKTITDSTKPGEVIEEVKLEEPEVKEANDDGTPNLGIPKKDDLPELKEIEIPNE